MTKKTLLWVGDAGCPSGFARATHGILDQLYQDYDVVVLGINYRGDPHSHPYPLYCAAAGGDAYGFGRLLWMCDRVRPNVIVLQTDGWFVPYYIRELRKRTPLGEYETPEYAALPVIVSVAIDAKNFRGDWIKDVTLATFWTDFARDEARIGGYSGPEAVIPLGVDLDMFYPVDRHSAMERQNVLPIENRFVVGNVNRNQPRKRLDLTMKYFAEWVHSRKIDDAQLFLHTAPTGEESVNLLQLAHYYGIVDKLALRTPETFYGNPDADMRDTYNCFDVCVSTTQGEGFGLTTLEAMACGTPTIVPDWSGLGDWAAGASMLIPCTSTNMQSPGLSVIGGIADEKLFIEALDLLYRDKSRRALMRELGLKRAFEPQFRWENIGREWVKMLDGVLNPPEPVVTGEIWKELKA